MWQKEWGRSRNVGQHAGAGQLLLAIHPQAPNQLEIGVFEPIGTRDRTEHRRPAAPRRDFPRGPRTECTTRGVRRDPLAPFRDFTE